MSLPELLGVGLGVIAACMAGLWLVSLVLRNASIVDAFWGTGFVVLVWLYAALADGAEGRSLLIATLVTVWGVRLSSYILWRNWGHGEDPRYAKWRADDGARFWWTSLFRVFLLQGVLVWLIAMPLLAACYYGEPDHLTPADVLGAAVWAVGFFFEAVGDLQLARFKSDPANKGKVMRGGLWRYTRHPNYFGEATMWWGYFIIAGATVDGLWTAYSPVLMTFLLLRVSGVALLERAQVRAKPQYREYVESTSAFLPWFPKRA